MATVRFIHFVQKGTSKEGIHITEDLTVDVNDLLPFGYEVESDTEHDIDLPSSFPIEYGFKKTDFGW